MATKQPSTTGIAPQRTGVAPAYKWTFWLTAAALLLGWFIGSSRSATNRTPAAPYAHGTVAASPTSFRPSGSGSVAFQPAVQSWQQKEIASVPGNRSTYPGQAGTVPFVAQNGTYKGQPNANGVPKTVYVNGYYRKDGTYVRSHYRSPPYSNSGSRKR